MREEAGLLYGEMEMRLDGPIRDISPCKDCPDRHPGCHDKCPGYAEWKSKLEKVNSERKKYNQMATIFSKIT